MLERVLDVVVALLCLWMIIDGLRTGKARIPVPFNEADYSRKDEPVAYWIAVLALVLAVVVALALFARTFH